MAESRAALPGWFAAEQKLISGIGNANFDVNYPESIFYESVILFGGLLAWKLLRSRWPGWLGFPLVLLLIQMTRDVGIGPLTLNLLEIQYSSEILFQRVHGLEALRASGTILLCYAAIFLGLVMVRQFWGYRGSSGLHTTAGETYTPNVLRRGWRVSFLFFLIGMVAQFGTLAMVLQGGSLASLASRRALFTTQSALDNPYYGYLRLLAPLMLYGALGMILFAKGRRGNLVLGLCASVVYTAFEVLYGGRMRTVMSVLCLAMAYHYGVRRLRTRDIRRLAALLMVALVFLSVMRFDLNEPGEVLRTVFIDVLSSGYSRVDDTALMLKTFPSVAPFTGLLNAAGAVARFLPGLAVPGTGTLFSYIVKIYYGGTSPYAGIGGENYSTASEFYSWGGWGAVAAFGILAGIFFGIIFEWQRRNSQNPFILLAVIVIVVWSFFSGLEGKLAVTVGSTVTYLLPIGVMAAMTLRSPQAISFLLALLVELSVFATWLVLRAECLRLEIVLSLPIIYFLALRTFSSVPQRKAAADISRVANRASVT